jgi:hypothetical protein
MDAFELHDARLIQERSVDSAANALGAQFGPVPEGRIWTVFAASFHPSVTETQTVFFYIIGRSGYIHAITTPESVSLGLLVSWPALTMGMDIKLFPGEYIRCVRGAATAGSTCSLTLRFIENYLPYYSYEDPLKKVIVQPKKHGSIFRAIAGTGGGGGGGGGGRVPPAGGGGGEPQPI